MSKTTKSVYKRYYHYSKDKILERKSYRNQNKTFLRFCVKNYYDKSSNPNDILVDDKIFYKDRKIFPKRKISCYEISKYNIEEEVTNKHRFQVIQNKIRGFKFKRNFKHIHFLKNHIEHYKNIVSKRDKELNYKGQLKEFFNYCIKRNWIYNIPSDDKEERDYFFETRGFNLTTSFFKIWVISEGLSYDGIYIEPKKYWVKWNRSAIQAKFSLKKNFVKDIIFILEKLEKDKQEYKNFCEKSRHWKYYKKFN